MLKRSEPHFWDGNVVNLSPVPLELFRLEAMFVLFQSSNGIRCTSAGMITLRYILVYNKVEAVK